MNDWKPPYRIEHTSQASKPGCWNVNEVRVIGPDDVQVGSYKYNYSSKPPFYPFELDGQWYALYSRDYTASRVMKLPSCEDVWGEDRQSGGFCPVQFYVPAWQNLDFGGDRAGKFSGTWHTDPADFKEPGKDDEHDWTYRPVQFHDFGFVCGCVWGDDSSWKVQFFDFSRIKEGIVTYDDRFGYFELHGKLSLAESVEVWGHGDDLHIDLTGKRSFKRDGKDADANAEAA